MLNSFFQSTLGRPSLIPPDDNWALLFVLVVSVAIAIYLEQKYTWASKLSGAILALIMALVLSNIGILPTNSTLYDDIIWGYAVPLGIPLLLLQCNMKKIWKETGRVMIVFLIGAVGTCLGALLAYKLLHNHVPEAAGVAAMMTGSYIGGGILEPEGHLSEGYRTEPGLCRGDRIPVESDLHGHRPRHPDQ